MCGQKSLYEQFGTYLVQNGLYMGSQLSTDSFAGELGNQTNLAVKVCLSLDEQLVNPPAYELDPTYPYSLSSQSRLRLRSSEFSGITKRANSSTYASSSSSVTETWLSRPSQNAATSYLKQWQDIALSSDKSHYTLSYGNNPS